MAEHPPSYHLEYRASAPGHRESHLTVILHLPPTLRPDGFEIVSFPVGHRTEVALPAATGGRPPYRYELTGCVVPAWIRQAGPSLEGSPTAANQHEPPRHCRWRVTDSIGGVAEFETEISVELGPQPQLYFPAANGTPLADGTPLPPLGTLVQGEPLPPRRNILLRASGAQGARISYRFEVESGPPGVLSPPRGLGLDPDGDPNWVILDVDSTIEDPKWPAGTYRLYYVASAPGYDDARLTVGFDLEDPLRLRAPSAGPFSFQVGELTRRSLPEAAGGAPPYRYSLEQCPLSWLEVVGPELAANPFPEHAGETRLCRYRVTDGAGAFVEITLRVSAVAGAGLPLEFEAVAALLLEHGGPVEFQVSAFTRRELPEATGGAPPYRYSLEQCSLDWLELVGSELAANPLPEHTGETRLCRYRVTDAVGKFVEIRFRVSAVAGAGLPLRFGATAVVRLERGGPLEFPVGAFNRRELPEATGGAPPYRYSLEQCPLDWLELVGTELAANPQLGNDGEERLCRYRVTDAVGEFVELSLHVSAVTGERSLLQFEAADGTLHEDGDSLSFQFQAGTFARESLPRVDGGARPYRYSLEQCSLDWLELVGTELAASPRLEHVGDEHLCRYQATDAIGDAEFLGLKISVTPAPIDVLQFENRHIVDRDVPIGSEIEPIVLPRALNGTGRIRYELSPVLPTGLSFLPRGLSGRPEVRGTPRAISLLTRYCIHATDATGAIATPRCFNLRTVGQEFRASR